MATCTCSPTVSVFIHLRPHQNMVPWQVERLYTGPQTDSELVEHMKACNAKGPLVVHIAKLFPKSDCSAFDAFGRVFSGTVRPGDKARRILSLSMMHGAWGQLRTLLCVLAVGCPH